MEVALAVLLRRWWISSLAVPVWSVLLGLKAHSTGPVKQGTLFVLSEHPLSARLCPLWHSWIRRIVFGDSEDV